MTINNCEKKIQTNFYIQNMIYHLMVRNNYQEQLNILHKVKKQKLTNQKKIYITISEIYNTTVHNECYYYNCEEEKLKAYFNFNIDEKPKV